MNNKVILIAGGAGSIGAATARLLARAGARIVLAARNKAKAEAIALQINTDGGDAYAIEMDVTDAGSVTGAVNTVLREFGRIDVLVNAFGTGMIQPLSDIKPEDARNVFDVNTYGTFLVTQAVLKGMSEQKSGTVIMIPGIIGRYVMRHASVYSASKFAVTGFTKALVEEYRRSNISFTLMHLGGVDSPFWDNPLVDMRVQRDKMLSVEEVAKAIYYACSQPAGSVLNEIVIQPESHQMV